ncbi:hypothetical protein FGO68_gene14297 [Halteria grandinella]|uniref:Histone deacetylase n=1 Tax=Halteria grandinella TaxID=5974 RepID=A0A8J8NUX6_HALGN|nr:hypothetical protein FGO68_gene14297 [Halteria grandinella]
MESFYNQIMSNRVSYFYDSDVGSFYYGPEHPMKPFRIKMTHQLILSYGLYKKMSVYQPHRATDLEMAAFHSHDYIEHLKRAAPSLVSGAGIETQHKFNVGENDCPCFPGLYEFSQISAGGSLDAAIKLNHKSADICINWAGGLHHAKKMEASGFCYVNDIVLAILELLKYHNRVLYIDIDVHHGDGVEEAFYCTNRVMTVSFHRYGDFFPGTGDVKDIGHGEGQYYALNVPLNSGIDDDSYYHLFKTIMEEVRQKYRPDAVVIQCGADSLAYDRLGTYNTTIRGHGNCVKLIKSWGLPMLVLGGGGYTIKNVARCWANETAICLNTELDDNIPMNDFYEFYGNDFKLNFKPKDEPNHNTKEYLDFIQTKCLSNLKALEGAPSVGIQDYIPTDFFPEDNVEQMQYHKAEHQSEY